MVLVHPHAACVDILSAQLGGAMVALWQAADCEAACLFIVRACGVFQLPLCFLLACRCVCIANVHREYNLWLLNCL